METHHFPAGYHYPKTPLFLKKRETTFIRHVTEIHDKSEADLMALIYERCPVRNVNGKIYYQVEEDYNVCDDQLFSYSNKLLKETRKRIPQESCVDYLTAATYKGKSVRWKAPAILTWNIQEEGFDQEEGRLEDAYRICRLATSDWNVAAESEGIIENIQFKEVGKDDDALFSFKYDEALDESFTLALAFFPHEAQDGERSVLMGSLAFDEDIPYSREGIIRHELGHVLGFRHEHIREEAHTGISDIELSHMELSNQGHLGANYLTAFNKRSVMHYPLSNGFGSSDFKLTDSDIKGFGKLYRTNNSDPAIRTFEVPQISHIELLIKSAQYIIKLLDLILTNDSKAALNLQHQQASALSKFLTSLLTDFSLWDHQLKQSETPSKSLRQIQQQKAQELEDAVRFIKKNFIHRRQQPESAALLHYLDNYCTQAFQRFFSSHFSSKMKSSHLAPAVFISNKSNGKDIPAIIYHSDHFHSKTSNCDQSQPVHRKNNVIFPIISFPAHLAKSTDSHPLLIHEVGHYIDNILGISKSNIEQLKITDAKCSPKWKSWMREIVADAIAISLSGDNYSAALAIFLQQSHDETSIKEHSTHPPNHLRIIFNQCVISDLSNKKELLKDSMSPKKRISLPSSANEDDRLISEFTTYILPLLEASIFAKHRQDPHSDKVTKPLCTLVFEQGNEDRDLSVDRATAAFRL